MCFKKNRLIGYSERGVMNALFYSIANDKAKMEQFLQLANETFSLQNDYKVYIEHSLSQFGTPDAVIVDSKSVFFIEAKVSTGNNWTLDGELTKFENYQKQQESGNKNKPKYGLFTQLYWKILIMQSEANKEKAFDKYTEKDREIGSNEIVKKLYTEIKKTERKPYYIGIIPTTEHKQFETIDFENNNTPTEIFFIPWKQVEEKFSHSYQLLFDAFEHNKGQIYNE